LGLLKRFHVLLCYKHYANNPGVSHIGLGVTAINCAKYLNSKGIKTKVLAVVKESNIEEYLENHPGVTHVNVSALWVKTQTFARLQSIYPDVQFSLVCHSNAAFLQHEPEAIRLIREAVLLEETSGNFHVCGNNERFVHYIENAYGAVCSYLPNIYWLNHIHDKSHHKPWRGGKLKIGMFGAMRSLKNFNTAAAAAVQICRELRTETELWVNVARRDSSDADVVLRAVRNSTCNMPNFKLIEFPWAPWPEFRKVVGSMNLLLQPSFSETFNNITVDGLAEGVASVVSNSIEWAPCQWKADVDSVNSIARIGMALIHDPCAVQEGKDAIIRRNHFAFEHWKKYLIKSYKGTLGGAI
jgi:hypothetical protein